MIGSSILSIIPDKTACRCRPASIPTARAKITDLTDLEIMWHLVSTCFSSLSTNAALVKCWPKCSQWIVIMVRSYERSLLWWNISVYWQKNIYQQAFIKHSNSFDVDSNVKRNTSAGTGSGHLKSSDGYERIIIKQISQKLLSKERVSKTWDWCKFLSKFLILSRKIVPRRLEDTKIHPGIIQLSLTWVQIKRRSVGRGRWPWRKPKKDKTY